jgi:hypothetical protein
MTVYGFADTRLAGTPLGEVVELYVDRDEAERAVRDLLADEPAWQEHVRLIEIELLD